MLMFIFNNTILQEDNRGASGLGGSGRIIRHCTTRNNILHVRQQDRNSIAVSRRHGDKYFDYDLTFAACPPNHEKHGLKGIPRYVSGVGFDPETGMGMFQLAPRSKGVDAALVIPNFCETINGNPPDLGAHERGTGRMQFGVRAQFAPPGTSGATGSKPANRPDAGGGTR